jgi:hypothetical protein
MKAVRAAPNAETVNIVVVFRLRAGPKWPFLSTRSSETFIGLLLICWPKQMCAHVSGPGEGKTSMDRWTTAAAMPMSTDANK